MTTSVDNNDEKPQSLADTLDSITRWISRYTVLPDEHCAPTLALWAAHTWVFTSFYTTPRLILSSPVPGSGKTRVLELLNHVSHFPKMTLNSSTAAIYRRINKAVKNEALPPTLLYDEVDALFGPRPTPQAEDMRSLINAGYKTGATVDRCEGDSNEVVEFPVYAPVALAGLAGHMPDTITTRAITIEMKKRRRGEKISPYRERTASAEMIGVREYLASWADGMRDDLAVAEATMPTGVEDRPAEVWEPLLVIADAAGGHWPTAARDACRSFVFAPVKRPPSQGIELLADIRRIMGHDPDADNAPAPMKSIRTPDLIEKLNGLKESGWRDMDAGAGISVRKLSNTLSAYDVRPVPIRDALGSGKGYTISETQKHGKPFQAGLADAWSRYLDAEDPHPTGIIGDNGDNGDVAGQTHQNLSLNSVQLGDTPVTRSVTGDTRVTENMPSTSTVTEVTNVTGSADNVGGTEAEEPTTDPLPDPDDGLPTTEQTDAVAAYLIPDGGLSPKTISEGTGVPEPTVEEVCRALVETGTATVDTRGNYTRTAVA